MQHSRAVIFFRAVLSVFYATQRVARTKKDIPRPLIQPILFDMHEPGLDISEEFYAYKDRASGYIARASHFPFQWGLPNGAKK